MKKNIIIGVLIVIILILGGSIFYLNMNKDKVGCKNVCKNEKQGETKKILSNEDALKIGKEKYEYTRDKVYACGHEAIEVDKNKHYEYSVTGMNENENGDWVKATNVEKAKNNFTSQGFYDWLATSDGVTSFSKTDIYIDYGGCGGDPIYYPDNYEIEVYKILEDELDYKITEYFYELGDNFSGYNKENGKKVIFDFELKKENNEWKVNRYTNPTSYYYLVIE